jgi:phosphomannomutase
MTDDLFSIFKSYDIRGQVGSVLNKKIVKRIAMAYGVWLPIKGTVAVGHDMRPDSKELAQAFIDGLTDVGLDVWDIGLVTSDMIYFAIGKWGLSGGAVITASHNPGKDNGIKLYRDHVTAVGLDSGLDKIRDIVLSKESISNPTAKGKVERISITKEWVEHCLGFISELKPFKVAIDAGNGMAGAILPAILPKLPLKVKQMYFDLDGTFPNHEANPQKTENLSDLVQAVKENSLDLGIAFDGDGDRAVLVDDCGRPVNGSDMISLISKLYLNKYPNSKIVYDVRTSRATRELIKQWGGEPIRSKAGRVYIGAKMREIGAPFGGETTGHMFFKENYDADSGLIGSLVAMQAISDSGKKLSELVDEYRRLFMIPEMNLDVSQNKEAVFTRLAKEYASLPQDKLDGLTVTGDSFWFNLRVSNTEPVMRFNAEANSKQILDKLVDNVVRIITKE